ncbi:ABC-F family ATP-binding cassette domain-containing protein [Actinomyces sp. zg-332]|uniref:ribosomal protection-like ABC-F family protein n=1 Tax=Actinomyces sp. zg-332 TaxID=2708340 RepID=UPI00141EDD3F|nr:ABC-F family ATP-binding cassette domain-containing protein [Actinomyces sp. zg-332]QPK93699.1 ABC-F family ATP-binding cassette domain-containing protein [Actinomyces sp. zg-332]
MIQTNGLTIRIGARVLMQDVSLKVDKGMKIGLIGRNGAGKTTLMRLLAGDTSNLENIEHDGQISSSTPIGYLPQDPAHADPNMKAIDRVLSVRGIDVLLEKIQKAEYQMSTLEGVKQQKAMEKYIRLDHEFTMNGGYAAKSQAYSICSNLGLNEATVEQPLGTLSGGQRRRVELARILFSESNILLLDEPTNHLDHDSILWLRDYLKTYSGGCVIISHDINLIEEVVNQVYFLDATRQTIDFYNMGYKAYIKQREDDVKRRRKQAQNIRKKADVLLAQGEKMRAKATKAVAAQQMIRRAEEMLASLPQEEKQEKVARLRFPTPLPCGKTPISVSELTKTYGSLEIFIDVNLAIDKGSKVVVLGLNGAGKTTLLKLIAGIEEPTWGKVQLGHGVKIGYYAQEHDTLDFNLTVYENLEKEAVDMDETKIRNILGQFLFTGEDVYKKVSVLSGGEKTRLALATLVTSGANVLLLDEPTNNLDPASREEVLYSLANYEGAVVLVTHDPEAVLALNPERVLLLPDGDEDLWNDEYMDLVSLT